MTAEQHAADTVLLLERGSTLSLTGELKEHRSPATPWIVTPTDFGQKCCPKLQMPLSSHLLSKNLFWVL